MKNSFIIKNADASFDAYYQGMRKRRVTHLNNSMVTGDTSGLNTSIGHESKFGLVRNRKPTARDGHSSDVDKNGCMFIFGGDRHHMPFNDLYMIKLPGDGNVSDAEMILIKAVKAALAMN